MKIGGIFWHPAPGCLRAGLLGPGLGRSTLQGVVLAAALLFSAWVGAQGSAEADGARTRGGNAGNVGNWGTVATLDIAGAAVSAEASVNMSAEQARLEALRLQQTRIFSEQEAACYQRFAVNSCIKEVQRARTSAFNAIRREEIRVNTLERERNAQAQRDALQERARERAAKDQDVLENGGAAQAQAKYRESQDKQTDHAQRLAPSGSSLTVTPAKGNSVQGLPAPSGPDLATQAQNRTAYARKQAEADKRRADLEQRLKEKPAKSRAPPLPVP